MRPINRHAYRAEVRIPAEISHTANPRLVTIVIIIDAVNDIDAAQKAADVGFATGLLLIGPLTNTPQHS